MIKTFPLFSLFFIPIFLFAQEKEFDMEIRRTQETVDEIKYTGFSTTFDLSEDDLQKKWWKYSKSIGIVENMKSHYLVKIPAHEKGFSSVSLIEKTSGDQKKSTIFLAVLDQTNNDYKEQVRNVLQEFKVQYYTGIVQQKIESKEKKLATVSDEYQNLIQLAQKSGNTISDKRQNSLLSDISKFSYQLEELKRSLINIQ